MKTDSVLQCTRRMSTVLLFFHYVAAATVIGSYKQTSRWEQRTASKCIVLPLVLES